MGLGPLLTESSPGRLSATVLKPLCLKVRSTTQQVKAMTNSQLTTVSNKPDLYSHFPTAAAYAADGVDITMIKFAKALGFVISSTDKQINGESFVVDLERVAHGFDKWIDKKLIASRHGFVFSRFVLPERHELGDNDSAAWPVGMDGRKSDPWTFNFRIRMLSESGETYSWTASSYGAQKAVKKLIGEFMKNGGLANPIVELGIGSYDHEKFGKVYTPKLTVIGWDEAPLALPSAAPAGPAPKPAPAAAVVSLIDDEDIPPFDHQNDNSPELQLGAVCFRQ